MRFACAMRFLFLFLFFFLFLSSVIIFFFFSFFIENFNMASAPDNSSLLSDQDINQFLV